MDCVNQVRHLLEDLVFATAEYDKEMDRVMNTDASLLERFKLQKKVVEYWYNEIEKTTAKVIEVVKACKGD